MGSGLVILFLNRYYMAQSMRGEVVSYVLKLFLEWKKLPLPSPPKTKKTKYVFLIRNDIIIFISWRQRSFTFPESS